MKKTVWVFQLFLLFWAAGALAEGLEGCDEHIKYGIPSAEPILLCRMGYALSHDPQKKAARWVAYHLTKEKLEGTQARSDDFRTDPDLPPGERSELKDYKNSGYDRGHLAPAADMKWDARAMSDSFLLSNMAPQVGAGFNRGIWAVLEERVRDWTMQRGAVFIFTGPIYAERHPHIGPNAVSVPTYFYKVVFDPAEGEAIAFILPNKKLKTGDLPNYITNVDTVEARTGLDFLSELEDSVEDLVEVQIQPSLW
ncbi:DNA/RNA non-specific endonuclease [Candidatus Manganitrophus noduliformans]|uniref:Endonuclease n=1 Tax=Candidatus Manganitrophus noduliformans TaxID=2606439 RepID=A0A7X6IBC3_9BACT|nr:DNA/RNA non-specific endonuclease [Candidatus Manganitrophus noduliformans]NKE71331.1 DNA/RNA non-specific endonuclease [Candidatus Manganitrophus noduliformans]